MEATHLAALPDPLTAEEHRTIAAERADTAHFNLQEVERHIFLIGDPVATNKVRAAIDLLNEVRQGFAEVEGAA